MRTCWQITFPQHPGQAFPIAASNGQTLPTRARSDVRKGKGYPIRILTRAEWDDQNKPAGPYLAAYQPMRPVPDVDFEAEDGSLWPTAEACLEHELEVRFGVKTLAAVSAAFEAAAALSVKKHSNDDLYDSKGNPPFSGVPETIAPSGPVPPSHNIASPELASGADGNSPTPTEADDDHHSMMNGPRITQSLPPEYLERILQVAKEAESQAAQPSPADCARLLASALSRRGLKVAEAAQATGLTPAQVRATADSLPGQFAQKGGRIHLIS